MSLLITRPDHDHATKYISCWSEKIINFAKKKGRKVVDLKGKKAIKKEVIGRIKKLAPSFIIFNGHGEDRSICGYDNEILVQKGKNEKILSDKITYALSCSSGKELGPRSVKDKKGAFIGYKDDFIFPSDRRNLKNPLKDKRAKPFMESSNQVAIALLKGHSAIDASEKSKELFKNNSQKLLSSNSDPDSLQDAKFLRWNYIHQVCLGDKNKTLPA